jgi:hypothetical protein
VLDTLRVHSAPIVTAWNKIDACVNPDAVRALAEGRPDTVRARRGAGWGFQRPAPPARAQQVPAAAGLQNLPPSEPPPPPPPHPRPQVVISGSTGEGVDRLLEVIADTLAASMVDMEVCAPGPLGAGALLACACSACDQHGRAWQASAHCLTPLPPPPFLSETPPQLLMPYAAGDLLDALHTTGSVHSLEYGEAGVRVSAAAPRHLVGKLKPYLVGASGDAAAAAGDVGSDAAAAGEGAFAARLFEDAQGDGSLWVESSSGWSDEEEDEEGGAWAEECSGGAGPEEDAELTAARRALQQMEAGRSSSGSGSGGGGRRRRGGGGGLSAKDAAARQRLLAHRLPREWEDVVQGGGSGSGGALAPPAAAAAGGGGARPQLFVQ